MACLRVAVPGITRTKVSLEPATETGSLTGSVTRLERAYTPEMTMPHSMIPTPTCAR